MKLEITSNHESVGRGVALVFSDQLPFVEAMAINDSAKQAQKVQRAHQREAFEVRRKSFMDRAVKIKPFATKQKAEAKISVDPPGGRARASILTQHEADDRKTPFTGKTIAVPTGHVQRTSTGLIRARERPSALELRERSGRRQRRGRRRGTFLRRDPGGRSGTIFERLPDGKYRTLYQLVPSVDLDQRLRFVENITRSVIETYPTNFVRRFDMAIGRRR